MDAKRSSTGDSRAGGFLPISRFALLAQLRQQAPDDAVAKQHERLFHLLAAWQHQSYRSRLNALKKAFLPFSPDRDTQVFLRHDAEQLEQLQRQLLELLTGLLAEANYHEITAADLDRIFSAASPYGLALKVDLSEYEEMLLHARGEDRKEKSFRHWKTLFLKKHHAAVPVYQRLFLLLKLKPVATRIEEIMRTEQVDRKKAEKKLQRYRANLPDNISDDHIIIKLFKNIPQADLEMLFPNTQVQLKPFDKLKLGITAGGGTIGSVTATATKVATATNPMAAAGALAGLAGVVFRQVMKFFGQRTKYMMTLAQNLYFHNLANNRAALTLLTDRAEEETFKNTLLAWSVLDRDGPADDPEQLRRLVEAFIAENFGLRVDFDIDAALAGLREAGLLANDRLAALPPDEACRILERKWRAAQPDAPEPEEDEDSEA